MKETVKTGILALLIAISLLQSYFLIYRLPGSNPVVKSGEDYVATDNMGTQLAAADLVYPEQMIIHMGNSKHTVFYPNSTFYNLIFGRLQGRLMDGFQRGVTMNTDWSRIRNEDQGIELQFGSGIPVPLLQKVMQIADDPLLDGESISRIFIYTDKGEDKVRVFFFSAQGDVVYEATKADFTVQDLKQHVAFGKNWTPYTLVNGTYYIPDKPLDTAKVSLEVGKYTVEQMQRSLFFDPSITRNIREKDNSEIYTDSKRSLQVRQDQNWMNYTDPAAASAGENSPEKNALSAVEFVNQHGGWSGRYLIRLSDETDGRQTVLFQQYYGAYPIIDMPDFHYGVMQLEMRQGTTTSYERSLLYLKEENRAKQVVRLPGGEELKRRIAAAAKEGQVIKLYPAYQPKLDKSGLTLTPVWVVKLHDGSERILP
ncbi:hypothetical protein DCC85_22590 [Paenibacillus sp. CAA11]|uniref:YycH family regulatory protein n=1 Tax=Paenibacillus sp. CAA11 TaxID=1532905 RepID=UPI000D33FC02|nr:two-component system activity regulator YycH [Paenibacillus sp. CAA11]AWB46683.1 hypothetical protein DCC85_22590 [Paenibacillus sp. CAA11]